MALTAGVRLGPYEILGLIGAGSMGEVYKARDTRLARIVAIKILPSQISSNPVLSARFEREAKTIATLSHPHICTLHDVGEHDGSLFLVMEHLAGQTLADRLHQGPLPLREALELAAQIADALAAAHDKGVIHRDLKPANVMLTKSGAKLLDFGVAKLTGRGDALASVELAATSLTSPGTVIGTLQYMAPEQIEGRAADARTDLWALGAMIYETVTGRRAFEAPTSATLIAAILEHEPTSLSALQPFTPPGLNRLVRQCLAKSPDDRPETANEIANELRWMREAGESAGGGRVVSLASLLVAGVGIAALLGAAALWWLRPPPAAPVIRSELSVGPAEDLNSGGCTSLWIPTPGGSRTALTWTPDGHALVFVGRRDGVQQLYVRALTAAEARPLAATQGAQVPAVSSDGQWVAFWAGGALKKMSLAGGPVIELVSGIAEPPSGLVWDGKHRLFFGRNDGAIWQVSPDGASSRVTSVGDGERVHIPSAALPDDRSLLYTVRRREWTWGDEEVVALDVATGRRTVLLRDAADARYVPTGHLVFMRRGTLFAIPFEVASLTPKKGPPVPVLEGIAQALESWHSGNITGAGQFAVASTGSLAWIPAGAAAEPDALLVSVDRSGRVSPVASPARPYGETVHVSPDGRRLAIVIRTLSEIGLWSYDLDRQILTPLHRRGEIANPLWSPSGTHVLFRSLDEGRFSLKSLAADGGAAEAVVPGVNFLPSSWAPGGRLLGVLQLRRIVVTTSGKGAWRMEPLRASDENERWPEMSPDGRWIAYASNVSGRFDLYVEPFPGRGARTVISTDGGGAPAWHPSGREIFYVIPADSIHKARMMSVTFEPGTPPRIGTPQLLFEVNAPHIRLTCYPVRCYDVSPDGLRFYAVQTTSSPASAPAVTHVRLVQNWLEELKAKVPTRK